MENEEDQRLELWAFAVALYARRDVSAQCISLQDDFGLDVPLALFSIWAGRRGGLARADAIRAGEVSAAWRNRVVAPVRSARRAMKGAAAAFGCDHDALESLRADVKRLELAAEKAQLSALSHVAAGAPHGPLRDALEILAAAGWSPADADAQQAVKAIATEAENMESAAPNS